MNPPHISNPNISAVKVGFLLCMICLIAELRNVLAVTESTTLTSDPVGQDVERIRHGKTGKKDPAKGKSDFTVNFNNLPDLKNIPDLSSSYSQKQPSLTYNVNNEAELRTGVSTQLMVEAKTLSEKMDKIVNDELQVKFMQDTYDSLTYLETSSSGDSQAVGQLARNIRSKLANFLGILNSNRRIVESLYKDYWEARQNWYKGQRSSASASSCCMLLSSELEYDSLFGANVSKNRACDSSSPVALNGFFNPTNNVSQAFKRNLLRNPTLKWQYFSSEGGAHVVYPAVALKNCSKGLQQERTVDMRNSPLYATTVRPRPKHVVIFIDRGYGIGENSLKIAKEAAEVALRSLSERDRVGVLSVGSATRLCEADRCYADRLAPASHLAKQQLVSFIRGVQPEREPTNHTEGLFKAFELIRRTAPPFEANNSAADATILYISAGQTLDLNESSSVINTAISQNRQLDNRVIIMTYALLVEVNEGKGGLTELAFLRDLSQQDNGTQPPYSVQNMPIRQKGVMTVLNQLSDLPSTVGRFYTIFLPPSEWGVTYSLPYQDPIGKGLIVSVTKPCFRKDNHLIGVIGLDISVADILQEVSYYEEGSRSYAFVIDDQGYTVAHPSLTKPIKMTEPPLFANIEHFESAVGFTDVKESMLRGESGSTTLKATPDTSSQDVTYSWEPVEGTPFIICTVSLMSQTRHMRHQTISLMESYFHRLDILPAQNMCMNFKQLATTDASALMLAPNAFISPFEHFTGEETKLVVQAYMAYVNDNTNLIKNPGLKPSIKKHVAATSSIDRAWRKQVESSALNDYILRRYISTTSGVVWMYPGTLLSKTFDPSRRPWYREAQDNPGLITVSSPYLDVGGAGYIVTLSKTIFEGNSDGNHSSSDPVAAVMGIDVSLQYYYKLLVDTLPVCLEEHIRCFIMDNKGYLVAHPHMIEPIHKAPVEQQHITHKEVRISNDLLYQREFVQKLQCNSYLNGTVQRYYSFNTSFEGLLSNKHNSEHCIQYKITGVPGTNAFVGIVNETCNTITAFCPCSMSDRICLNCRRMEQTECECPCECDLSLDPCTGDLSKEEDRNPACPGNEEEHTLPEVSASMTQDLPPCLDTKCERRKTWDTCFGALGCEWCLVGIDGASLKDPYCGSQIECFGGIVGAETPYHDQLVDFIKNPLETGPGSHIGSVAGALLGIVTFLVLVVYVYCHHVNKEARRQGEMGQNGSGASVRVNVSNENVAVIEGSNEDDPNNPPGGGRYGQGNIALAAIEPPNPYHQAPRRGIRMWRRHPHAPSESDHGYSTMTPHEDSEYHYVEPEPMLDPSRHRTDNPPPPQPPPRSDSPSVCTSLLDCESDAATCGSGPITIPKIDPPPQTVIPRKSHRLRTRVDVHSVDTVF